MSDRGIPTTPTRAIPLAPRIRRFTLASIIGVAVSGVLVIVLAVMPYIVPIGSTRQLTDLFVFIVLATSWNLLAGFGGMVSIGWNSRRSCAYSASSVPSAAWTRVVTGGW